VALERFELPQYRTDITLFYLYHYLSDEDRPAKSSAVSFVLYDLNIELLLKRLFYCPLPNKLGICFFIQYTKTRDSPVLFGHGCNLPDDFESLRFQSAGSTLLVSNTPMTEYGANEEWFVQICGAVIAPVSALFVL